MNYVKLTPGTPVPADGLCSTCLNPSVAAVPALILGDSGVGQTGEVRWCVDFESNA